MSTFEVCPLEEIEPNSARKVEIGGHEVAVIRLGDEVFAMGDRCSHANISLSEGEVNEDEATLECWKHGSTFSVKSGEPTCLPATKPVPVYEAVVEADVIKVTIEDGAGS